MAKVTLIQQVFNSRKWMELVYPAMAAQSYPDVEIIAQIVADDGGCEEYIREHFPQIKILKPGYNIGFARGHNEIFASTDSEYYQLVNPDLILEPAYVERLVAAFERDSSLGAATGKLLKYSREKNERTDIIDTTGVVVSVNGRARDRGQHETDRGQYDSQTKVVAVSGAGPMYRKSALEAVKYPRPDGRFEYFDEDFHSYWEDVDLSLRMQSAGWSQAYVPLALGYHGRTAGSSKDGYTSVGKFVKHHKQLSDVVKKNNLKNHIFLVVKNFPSFSWKFFVREFFMLGYIAVFETRTLAVWHEFWKQWPLMWKKRSWIREHRTSSGWAKLLNNKGLLS